MPEIIQTAIVASPTKQPIVRWAALGRTLCCTIAIAGSLLTFPSMIPWLVAFWLLWYSQLVCRGRPAWAPLVVCVAILAVKGVDWPLPLIELTGIITLVAVMHVYMMMTSRIGSRKYLAILELTVTWLAWASMSCDWYRSASPARYIAIQPGRPVVCIGDSLTAFGFPKQLEQMVTIPVVDLSCNGITTKQALAILPRLAAARPQVVVIELGGHDFLSGRTRADAKDGLNQIIDACQAAGAEVILMEIPRGFIYDGYFGLEREIVRRKKVVLIPDTAIRRLVLWGPDAPPGQWLPRQSRLSDDGLHPNALGNQMLAGYVADALLQMYGPVILQTK